jgi:hypothetical protein
MSKFCLKCSIADSVHICPVNLSVNIVSAMLYRTSWTTEGDIKLHNNWIVNKASSVLSLGLSTYWSP